MSARSSTTKSHRPECVERRFQSAGYARVLVALSAEYAGDRVSLALANGTATGSGTDYGATTAANLQISTDGGLTWSDATSYTFAPGSTSLLARTPIIDDAVYEPGAGETFRMTATQRPD